MKLEDRVRCSQPNCTKEVYDTPEDALDEIERILGTQRKLNDIKPCRAYRCDCGKYALTSKVKVTEY